MKLYRKVTLFTLAFSTILTLGSCGESSKNPNDTDKPNNPNTQLPENRDPYVTKVDNIRNPNKVDYFEGDFIDTKGFYFDAYWNIDGEEVLIEDMTASDCDSYSPNKSTPLTLDHTKITFTIGEYQFDVPINVSKKVAGSYTLTLKEGTFEGDKNSINLKEGEVAPEIKFENENFGGWYYLTNEDEVTYIKNIKEFKMPNYDVTLCPIVFNEVKDTNSRFAGGGSIPPVYLNNLKDKTKGGEMDETNKAKTKYTLFSAKKGDKLFGNNGAHLKSGRFFARWTFTYIEGADFNFNFFIDKDNVAFMKYDNLILNTNNKVATFITYSDSYFDNNTKTFGLELNEDLKTNTSFYLECSLDSVEE